MTHRNPPRIAFFLATSGHSGVDRLVKNLLPSIKDRGYEVDLIKIKKHGPFLKGISGINIIELNVSHVYSSIFYLLKYIKKNSPYIFVTDKDRVNRTALLASLFLKNKVSTKFVVRIGTTVSVNLKNRGLFDRFVQKLSMGKLYKYAHAVLVPSRKVAEDMCEYIGIDKNHIKVVPSPVVYEKILTTKFPPPNHPWFLNTSIPVILGVGELCSRKDFATLIRAFKLVRSVMNAKLVILGKGKQLNYLKSLSKELGISKDVDFPGFVNDPLPFMQHSKVFVSSSLWEGSSLVLMEALAVGTPVVSTLSAGGHAEVLENGKYGMLVPVKDPEKMAEAIIDTLKRPLKPEFLKQAALPYTVENGTNEYLKAFGLPPYWKKQ